MGRRNGLEEVKSHPFCRNVDWDLLYKKKITPPIRLNFRVSNFDPQYTGMHLWWSEGEGMEDETQADREHSHSLNNFSAFQDDSSLNQSQNSQSSFINNNPKVGYYKGWINKQRMKDDDQIEIGSPTKMKELEWMHAFMGFKYSREYVTEQRLRGQHPYKLKFNKLLFNDFERINECSPLQKKK